jgi:uncharacterized protein (DUF302 family)
MTGDQDTATLIMHQPPNEAIREIRRALAEADLEIAAELDLAGRVRKTLRIDIPPCRVLCVDCSVSLLEALILDRSAAVLLPLHLVVAGQGNQTLVYLLTPSAALYAGLPLTARTAMSKLQACITSAVESIAIRQDPIGLSA